MDTKTVPPMTDSAYESGAAAFVEVMRRRHTDAAVVRTDDVVLAPATLEAEAA